MFCFIPVGNAMTGGGVFCCLVSIVVDEDCHMVLPSACQGNFTFRVSSCLRQKINCEVHDLTKDTKQSQ